MVILYYHCIQFLHLFNCNRYVLQQKNEEIDIEQVRGRPKYLHNALNFQSDFPNLIYLRANFSQSQGPPAPGSERQENPCVHLDSLREKAIKIAFVIAEGI